MKAVYPVILPSDAYDASSWNGNYEAVTKDAIRDVIEARATLTWSIVTANQTLVANTGVLANKGTLLTLTLPASVSALSRFQIVGMNAGLWKIAQNSGQVIHFGNKDTSTGTSGYLQSTNAYDTIEIICVADNTDFVVVSPQGNITVT